MKKNNKEYPVYSGVLKYFPDALMEVSRTSLICNEQHNQGEPLHWDKSKSKDEADALVRHLLEHSKGNIYDEDGTLHLSKVAWRSLALLERFLEDTK